MANEGKASGTGHTYKKERETTTTATTKKKEKRKKKGNNARAAALSLLVGSNLVCGLVASRETFLQQHVVR